MIVRFDLALDAADVDPRPRSLPSCVPPAILRRPRNTAVVGTFHAAAERFWPYAVTAPLLRRVAKRLDATTAVSPEARKLVRRYVNVDPEIVPNGVDVEAYEKAEADEDALRLGKVVLLVGRVEPRKGFDIVCRAFARIASDEPDAHLLVTATPDQLPEATLSDRIHCSASSDDARKLALHRAADVVCCASTAGESFGMVVLEGLAGGSAVIASDIPGFRYAGGDVATYAAPGDVAAWATRSRRLLADDTDRERLAARGPDHARHFDWSRIAEQSVRVYERALEQLMADLLLEIAKAVRSAVLPHLGSHAHRESEGVSVGGDPTFGIDEIAEDAANKVLEEASGSTGLAWYTEDRGLVERGDPERLLVIDPIDGTRPAGAGLETCMVSIAAAPWSRDATLGDVDEALILGIKDGALFRARKGAGVRIVDRGETREPRTSGRTSLDGAFFTYGLRGRPTVPSAIVLEELIDGSGVKGGTFDLGSATFGMIRRDHRTARRVCRPGPAHDRRRPGDASAVRGDRGRRCSQQQPVRRRGRETDLRGGRVSRDRCRRTFARRSVRSSVPGPNTACRRSCPRRPSCTGRSSRRSIAASRSSGRGCHRRGSARGV